MDYKKKALKNFNRNESHEEIDTRLASGWYVDINKKKKSYKTNQISYKISKKIIKQASAFPLIFNCNYL